jgi:hypothetical protein
MSDEYFEFEEESKNPCVEIHMQASMESIEDMVQNSAKFRPGDKVCLKRSEFKDITLGTKEELNFIYTITGATWKSIGIMYTVEYNGLVLATPIHEESLQLAPIHERRKLDLK